MTVAVLDLLKPALRPPTTEETVRAYPGNSGGPDRLAACTIASPSRHDRRAGRRRAQDMKIEPGQWEATNEIVSVKRPQHAGRVC
jgi:hypothetical protein